MYLPTEVIERILSNCGYLGWDSIFVSSDHMATKTSGELFKIAFRDTGCEPAEFLHIGDNKQSDVLRPRLLGAHSYWLRKAEQKPSDLADSFLIGSRAVAPTDFLGRLGYTGLGPILVGFCEWLTAELAKDGIQKVFYLARDGLIIQKSMNKLAYDAPSGEYLYASRRALQVPSFFQLSSLEEALELVFLPRKISLLKLFTKFGLDPEAIDEMLAEVGINIEIERNTANLLDDEDARKSFDLLIDKIHENASAEFDLLSAYLKQIDFAGKVAIVDIGWFGNMQLALEKVANAAGLNADIYGYYVGLSPYGKHQLAHKMKGYLFDSTEGLDLFNQERNYNLIFETVFSAPHGTTRGYRLAGNTVAPVLAAYEGEEACVGYEAEKLREGALEFVSDWAKVFGDTIVSIEPKVAMKELNRLGNAPTLSEANYFGEWGMEADNEIVFAAKPQSLNAYLLHPKIFISDFSHASWKVGFLKRLFKLPLPYDKFWNVLHDAYERKTANS